MAIKTFTTGELLTASDTNTYLNDAGLVLITSGITVSSAGGTAATVSNGTVTIGTSNTSVTVSGAFSATYNNYRIIVSGGLSSANGNLNFQLSNSTGSTYSTSGWFMTPGTATLNAYSPAATTQWLMSPMNTTRYMAIMDLINPFQSQQTFGRTTGAGTVSAYDFIVSDTSTASSTGFKLLPDSPANITGGTIRVYGYRQV